MARSDTRDAPPRRRRSFLQGLVYWGAVLFVWGLIFALAFLAVFAADLPDTSNLNAVRRQPSISYLDRSGALVSVRGSQYAPPVDLDKLPPYVPAAFVAIEDRWFYWHFGFNPWGIVRSQVYNLTHRGDGPLRGGSTITQQLARNLFLTMDQTYRRKAQELVLAIWLETKFTKKEILALYLNRVYFGAGAYGIEAAAQRYFGKPADQLSIGESALLAGMMKGPSRYSPVSSADRAARRATVVLNEMVRAGAITPAQRAEAIGTPVRVNPTLASQRAQYFTDWVDEQVRGLVGEPIEDLIVETTLDLPIQVSAEQALRAGVAGARGQGVQQGALVALDGEGRCGRHGPAPGNPLTHPAGPLHGPRRRRGQPPRDGPGLHPLLEWRLSVAGLGDRAGADGGRQGALRPFGRPAGPDCGDFVPGAAPDEPDAAPGPGLRHRNPGSGPGLRPRRQDRHHQRLQGRLVRRLHRRLRGGGLGGPGRQHPHAADDRRRGPGGGLAGLHEPRPPPAAGRTHPRWSPATYGRRRSHRRHSTGACRDSGPGGSGGPALGAGPIPCGEPASALRRPEGVKPGTFSSQPFTMG